MSSGIREAEEPKPKSEPNDSSPNKPLGFELTRLKTDHPYLDERGISSNAIAHFGLAFCEKGAMSDRIVIPIRNADGKIVAYAGRWPRDPPAETSKYKLPAGFKRSQEVFSLEAAKEETDEEPLIVLEGFFDCISLWHLGLTRTVELKGSALSAAQEALLREHTTPETRIILMLDEDDAGRAARAEIAARLVQGRFVKAVSFPAHAFQPESLSADDLAELL